MRKKQARAAILGVNIDTYTFAETLEICKGYLKSNKAHFIVTPNPEIIVKASENPEFMNILNAGDLFIPDGIGVVLAAKLFGIKIKERVTGYDLSLALLEYIKDTEFTAYFFGSAEGVAERAKAKMEAQYKGLKIVGCHDGMDFKNRTQEVITGINAKKPDIILVGLGMVNQETWIYENAKLLDAKLLMGVGGVLDHFAGDKRIAPAVFRKTGLEWLYRRITLKRKGRQKALKTFARMVFKERFGKK